MAVLLLLVIATLGAFWVYQLVQLMTLEDELFPGRQDKLIWAFVFLLAPPLAPFAFLLWKAARVGESHTKE